jgi:hypothetical protein
MAACIIFTPFIIDLALNATRGLFTQSIDFGSCLVPLSTKTTQGRTIAMETTFSA